MNDRYDLCFFSFFFFGYLIVGDYKEGYYIGVEVPKGDPQADKPFYGPNVWPAEGNPLNKMDFVFGNLERGRIVSSDFF